MIKRYHETSRLNLLSNACTYGVEGFSFLYSKLRDFFNTETTTLKFLIQVNKSKSK